MLKLILVVITSLAVSGNALAETKQYKMHMMHQMSKVDTNDINEMFRFSPEYLHIEVGDTVRFSGSTGQHTVTTVPGMLPDGAEKIEIHSIPSKDIAFPKPGIYGIKCRVHNRYGMVALIVVGDASVNLGAAKNFRLTRFGKKKMQQLLERAEAELKN
ncbi:MAG: plastocyanin/azurin family copper-binding protein [Oceanospirillaceae bacterium]